MDYQKQQQSNARRPGTGLGWAALSLLLLGAAALSAQTQVDLRTQSKRVDFTQATTTAPVKSGTTLPATCGVGELYYKSNASAGQNLYGCTVTNTWTLLGDGGSGGGGSGITTQKTGSGDPNVGAQTCTAPSISVRTLYFDTVAKETWQCIAVNTWKRILDTAGTGPVSMSGNFNPTNLTEPATTGQAAMQFGDGNLEYFPRGGLASGTVIAKSCTTLPGDFVSSIATNGTITCGTAARASDVQTGRIDSVASGNLLASAAAGLYRINTYIHTGTVEGAACLIHVDIGYTYGGSGGSLQVVATHNLNSAGAASESVHLIRVDAATNITRSLTDNCTRSAYIYDYTIVLERVN
jgi:hypothetical protein